MVKLSWEISASIITWGSIFLAGLGLVKAAAAKAKVALENLLAGNQRFIKGERAPRDFDLRREKLVAGQKPFAIILGCSDSRVSPEMLFDKNLGEIFVVRTAGQVLEATTIASIEYAVDHLEAPLLFILGHEQCGAVTAAIAHKVPTTGNLGLLLSKIQPAINRAKEQNIPPEKMVEAVTDLHLEELAEQIFSDSEIIRTAVVESRLRIVTGKYHMGSGEVKIHTSDYRPGARG
jgi:carbonic anhydrase